MKNICFLNTIKFWGGGEKLHFDYALEFTKRGYKTFVICNKESKLQEACQEASITTLSISASNISFLNPFKIVKLVNYYRTNNIDTVIFTTSQDAKLGSLSAKIAGVKNRVYLRGLASEIKPKLTNKLMFKHWLTHLIVNSDATLILALKNFPDIPSSLKIGRIYHGIKTNQLNIDNQRLDAITKNAHGIILGNAGRLTSQKGQKHLIKIAKNLHQESIDFTLFIAGTGELHDELLEMIEANNLQKNIFLLGFVEKMELFMSSIDIFLLSSEWEGFGYVIVEAMVKEKPVIAFNISSNPEIITPNKTGLLADFCNTDQFSEHIKLLINNVELRNKIGKKAKNSVLERFNISDRISELENFLLD